MALANSSFGAHWKLKVCANRPCPASWAPYPDAEGDKSLASPDTCSAIGHNDDLVFKVSSRCIQAVQPSKNTLARSWCGLGEGPLLIKKVLEIFFFLLWGLKTGEGPRIERNFIPAIERLESDRLPSRPPPKKTVLGGEARHEKDLEEHDEARLQCPAGVVEARREGEKGRGGGDGGSAERRRSFLACAKK